jgi:hypothetical protein
LKGKNVNPKLLMISSAGIIGLLGLVHLVLTFWGPKHLPRDRSLVDAMANIAPVITTQTTIWKMWMGFNASHSMGLMLFGLTYSYLALAHSELLFHSIFLKALGFGMLTGYVILARLYWFIPPLAGASISLILYMVSVAVAWGV